METVLIIDDEDSLRKLLSRVIELEGFNVIQAPSVREGMKAINRENVQVVITDVKLPDGNGVDLAGKIKQEHPAVEIIVLTAFGSIQDGVKAIKNGAFDYLTKGEHQEKILPLVRKAAEKAQLQQKVLSLESRLQDRYGFSQILGKSKIIQKSIELAEKVAVTDSAVLLLGETGTGKEVFSQAIHYKSHRSSKPFVALNCSAFARELLESELFGHAEGAFTGAIKSKRGHIEEAHEGTLFLDEIGEMDVDLQAKLLRVLETGEYFRVGESKPRKVNTRLIAATNRDLEKESDEGKFRKDLFYRISVFVISLPALRDRKADIPDLVDHFVKLAAMKTNQPIPAVSDAFMDALQKHSWKGNIRELKNVIERCVILSEGELLPILLPFDLNSEEGQSSFDLSIVEKNHIAKVLRHTLGNKTQTAKLLGIGLTTLYQKIKDYKL